jgi:hypothetical protein
MFIFATLDLPAILPVIFETGIQISTTVVQISAIDFGRVIQPGCR